MVPLTKKGGFRLACFRTEDHVDLYFEEEGKGKPVVLIHGWSASRKHFKKQINELAKYHRVICYDLRGHGDSSRVEQGLTMDQFAKDLRDLLTYLKLEDVSLVGWSMGTHIIWEYVKNYGCDNIESLCFIDMTPKLLTDEEWDLGLFGDFKHEKNLGTLASIATDWETHTQGFVPAMFAPTFDDSEMLQWCFGEAEKNTPHVMLAMWIAMALQDYREILPKISVPSLITYGAKSFYRKETSEYLQAQIPDATLVRFEQSGHAPQIEEAEKFNDTLLKFLGKVKAV
jgi:pimeloyl-ACP methyl ester carboxylesterase